MTKVMPIHECSTSEEEEEEEDDLSVKYTSEDLDGEQYDYFPAPELSLTRVLSYEAIPFRSPSIRVPRI